MAGWIPDEKLSEIRNASDIVEIVSEVVILKRAGKNFIGLCPFHSEKTPSFTVNPEKQIFHCFGCGVGGNVFNFLMKYQGRSFPEAVNAIARRYGISIPQEKTSIVHRKTKTEKEHLGDINQTAMEFYHGILLDDPGGSPGKAYLHKRGITEAVIEAFRIGFAPKGWDHLAAHLNRKRFSAEMVFKSGLIIPRKKGSGGYDRFRNRIVFPIRDLEERVIGFGGRVLDDSLPKYINSPESFLFVKSRSLYGLERARKACRGVDSVYIVEGYFDVITLHRHGLENTVAPLGTGLTADHIHLLKGFAQTFYLVFDPDAAGIKAVERIIPTLIRENISAKVITLPDGKDPDTFVLENGPNAFSDLAAMSRPIMTHLIESAIVRHGPSPTGKSRVVGDMENVLASIDDGVNRAIFVKAVAEKIGIEETILLERVRQARQRNSPDRDALNGSGFHGNGKDAMVSAPHVRFEKKILSMMLQYPTMIPEIQKRMILERFVNAELKAIGRLIQRYRGAPEMLIPDIISMAKNTEMGMQIAQLAAREDSWNTDGCLKLIGQFESYCNHTEKASLNARIRAAQDSNDQALLATLLGEKQKLLHN